MGRWLRGFKKVFSSVAVTLHYVQDGVGGLTPCRPPEKSLPYPWHLGQ